MPASDSTASGLPPVLLLATALLVMPPATSQSVPTPSPPAGASGSRLPAMAAGADPASGSGGVPGRRPTRLDMLTILSLADMQRAALEIETARKAGLLQTAGTPPGAAMATPPPVVPLPLAARDRATITLAGVITVKGAVREVEVISNGTLVRLTLGQQIGGWRVAAWDPEEVRIVAGRRTLALRPGDTVEAR